MLLFCCLTCLGSGYTTGFSGYDGEGGTPPRRDSASFAPTALTPPTLIPMEEASSAIPRLRVGTVPPKRLSQPWTLWFRTFQFMVLWWEGWVGIIYVGILFCHIQNPLTQPVHLTQP